MALFEVIRKTKADGNLIWRYPKRNFNTLSQLIVQESQEAVFFSNGKALDLFGPGKYTLNTNNIPILRNFINLPTGGKSPFTCEVYFIDKSINSSRWGTSSKIEFLEPKYNFPIAIGACGEFRFTIEDSRKLLVKLVGINKDFDAENIDEFFQSNILTRVKTYIAQITMKEKISIFEIDQQLEKFSEELKEKLEKDFEEFGIKLEKFFVTNIAKPEDDKQYLEFKELYFKQTVRLAEAELQQKIDIIGSETEAKKTIIASDALATKRRQEGYTYQEEQGYKIGEKVAENQAVGQFTNVGVGLGMMSGIGAPVSDKVSKQVSAAFMTMDGNLVCPSCNSENDKGSLFCNKCGNKLARENVCQKCGAQLQEGSLFCNKCGERVM